MSTPTYADRGSQHWLQLAVAEAPELLRASLTQAGALRPHEQVSWSAPLAAERFAEPRDAAALRKAGIATLPSRSLASFWPKGGPVWDAVARVGSGSLFVEAKAHTKEAESPPSQAGPASLSRIKAALAEARAFYAPSSTADWHLTYYQYANRLAHHFLLANLNGLDSRLVFLYFLNDHDMRGPSQVREWEAVTHQIHAALGLPASLESFGVYHAYLDVRALQNAP